MVNDPGKRSDFLLYTTPDGDVRVDVFFEDETVWLTQKRMAELFSVDVRTINEHLQNVYDSGELVAERTIRKNRIVQNSAKKAILRNLCDQFCNTISYGRTISR